MYDHPGVRPATDAFWAAIRDRLRASGCDAPQDLTRSDDLTGQWHSPMLLLSQTCGLPYRMGLHREVALVGAIDYGLEDTEPGYYRSVFVARLDDARETLADFGGAVLAYNDGRSHSGWAAAASAPVRFRIGPKTRSHRNSLKAVVDGEAEIAAVDAVAWRLIATRTDAAAVLKAVGVSASAPGLPLITAFPAAVVALRRAIAGGIADLSGDVRGALGLEGLVNIPESDYLAVPIPPTPEAYSPQNP